MEKLVYRIDEQGFIIEDVMIGGILQEDNTYVYEIPINCVDVPLQGSFYKPQWDNNIKQWVDVGELEELNDIKHSVINKLNNDCERQILSGFTSNALGDTYEYKSDRDDQSNLIGVVAGGEGGYFKCKLNDWEYLPHTHEQIKKVLNDGKNYKLTLLQQNQAKKEDVMNAKSVAEIEEIVGSIELLPL